MTLDPEHCYQVLLARDARWDGVFFVGVSTTGVYCRPICGVRTPRRDRCSFHPSAASAEAAGFRPCLRCRPELAPGRAPADAVRSMARCVLSHIEAGALRSGGSEALAARLGLSSRQLRRIIKTEFGVTPGALARTRRLLLAKQLLTDSALRVADVAYASGFSSLRQFNREFAQAYRMNPSRLRRQRGAPPASAISLRLGYRPPLAWGALTDFLASRGCPRIERCIDGAYARTVRIGDCAGWLRARPESGELRVEIAPSLLPQLPALQTRIRRMFDLDAQPAVIDAHLGAEAALSEWVRRTPGLRVPGAVDGFELALRAVLGQQISVRAASTVFARFVDAYGSPVLTPVPGLDRLPPTAGIVAQSPLRSLMALGLTMQRARTIKDLALAVAEGRLVLDPPVQPAVLRSQLEAISGIGPWTREYLLMRAIGDADAFPHTDLGLLRALQAERPQALLMRAEAWRPWRAYAALHAWTALMHAASDHDQHPTRRRNRPAPDSLASRAAVSDPPLGKLSP